MSFCSKCRIVLWNDAWQHHGTGMLCAGKFLSEGQRFHAQWSHSQCRASSQARNCALRLCSDSLQSQLALPHAPSQSKCSQNAHQNSTSTVTIYQNTWHGQPVLQPTLTANRSDRHPTMKRCVSCWSFEFSESFCTIASTPCQQCLASHNIFPHTGHVSKKITSRLVSGTSHSRHTWIVGGGGIPQECQLWPLSFVICVADTSVLLDWQPHTARTMH